MGKLIRWAATAACGAALLAGVEIAGGQTPEQEKQWAVERERSNQAAQARAEQLARERAARKANPMGWVRSKVRISLANFFVFNRYPLAHLRSFGTV